MKTVGNGWKTSQPLSTFTFEYENKSESGKAGHKKKHTNVRNIENFENELIQAELSRTRSV